mgnify:CR=1 FL=1|jgi:hypothetical protein
MSELINQFKAKAVKSDRPSDDVNLQESYHRHKHHHHHKARDLDNEEEEIEKQSDSDKSSAETKKILKQAEEALKGTDKLEMKLKHNGSNLKSAL